MAWRQKKGISTSQAMQMYIQESDRQVRVYGTQTNALPQTPQTTPVSSSNASSNGSSAASVSRGLAAIPLLEAAGM